MRSVCSLILMVFVCQAAFADTLKDRMSAEDFAAAGLEKLSEAELAHLTRWLDGLRQPPAAPAAPVPTPAAPEPRLSAEERFGQEQIKAEPEPDVPAQINARIKGEFRGWDGKTIFRLDNGQVWQQRVGGRYRGKKRVDPEVVIEKGRFGYYLKLVDDGRSVGVRRLR